MTHCSGMVVRSTSGLRPLSVPGGLLVAAVLALVAGAALLAGWAPLSTSIVAVFLFAGPHNWLEARYFLNRLPGRFGPLRSFLLVGAGGCATLTLALAAIPWLGERRGWDGATWSTAIAVWNTLLIAWIAALLRMRGRQPPRRDWSWATPVCFLLAAVNWLSPHLFGLGLVYLHPLMALWILERELRRGRSPWLRAYYVCLAALPAFVAAIWWHCRGAAPLPVDRELFRAIGNHAGASILSGVSSHLLVSIHTFLEMVHYGVWVAAIPLVGIRVPPWRLHGAPLARRSAAWRRGLIAALAFAAFAAVVLWGAFLLDYATTRRMYFTVAILHVLAEAPFLLRAL